MSLDTTPAGGSRIVIFGATSAIAHATARLWVRRGARIVLIGRNVVKLEAAADDLRVRGASSIATRVADLDDLERHAELIADVAATLGGIDIALIAHGTLPDQRACEREPARALQALHTNGISAVHLASALGLSLAAQGHGTIAAIGSVAGDRGRQSNYVYGAAKGLLALHLQGLRNHLHAQGVRVLTIKPGFVDTPMTAGIEKKGALWATPERVAEGIVKAIDGGRDVVYLPGFWRLVMAIIKSIPEPMFKRLSL